MVDATNANTALCSALVDELARCGVEHAVIAPGSRSAPLSLALWNERRMTTWSIIDERCAGFFALGVGLTTGRPAVVVTTSGTAAANLHPAIAEAAQSEIPLIAITADRPPELRARSAGQTIDQIKLFGGDVRWFCELGNIDADDRGLLHFRSSACRAVSESLIPSGAPVHLNVPLREPLAPRSVPDAVTAQSSLALEGRAEQVPLTQSTQPYVRATEQAVESLAGLIAGQSKGLIVVGRQPDGALPEALTELAALTGYPILAEPLSQVRCGPHDRARVIAHYDSIFRDLPDSLTPALVLRFGDLPTSKSLRQWLTVSDCHQILIRQGTGWNDPTLQLDLIERVHPVQFCRDLTAALPRATASRDWEASWVAADQATSTVIDEQLAEQSGVTEPALHRRLDDALPNGSTVFVASSMPVRDLETFLAPNDRSLEFLSNRGANGIDGTISTALGAAAASSRHTVVVLGDVAFYHDMNALLPLSRDKLDVTVLVINNSGGRIFDFLPIAEPQPPGYTELFRTDTALDIEKAAALYELPYTLIGALSDLDGALSKPGIVEVVTDGDSNVALHRAITQAVSRAIRD